MKIIVSIGTLLACILIPVVILLLNLGSFMIWIPIIAHATGLVSIWLLNFIFSLANEGVGGDKRPALRAVWYVLSISLALGLIVAYVPIALFSYFTPAFGWGWNQTHFSVYIFSLPSVLWFVSVAALEFVQLFITPPYRWSFRISIR